MTSSGWGTFEMLFLSFVFVSLSCQPTLAYLATQEDVIVNTTFHITPVSFTYSFRQSITLLECQERVR